MLEHIAPLWMPGECSSTKTDRFMHFYEDLRLVSQDSFINGPVHGLVRYAKDLGVKFELSPTSTLLKLPHGVTVDFCTSHHTHFNASLRDTCRYAAVAKLQTRAHVVNPSGKAARQDMVGITPLINQDATCQLQRSRRRVEGISDATHFLKKGPEGKYLLPLHVPCGLCPKSKRRQQHILAGSSRPPHRLLHAQKVETDVCTCVACNNARCDTSYIFWHCKRWDSIRQVYLDAVEDIIRPIKALTFKRGVRRIQLLRNLLDLPCFQQCGICPYDLQTLKPALEVKVNDPHHEAPNRDQRFCGDPNADTEDIGGCTYTEVYTDGSCLDSTNHFLARAGLGFFYAKNSVHNCAFPLEGPVQTSYRAELKALMHAVHNAATPVIVMCDCKSVVNTYNNYVSGRLDPHAKLAERDLWDQIFHLVDPGSDCVVVRWMPSHLDEPDRCKDKNKFIRKGVVTESDIYENAQVDNLAKQGVGKHPNMGIAHHAAYDATKVACIIQKMQLHIWEMHMGRQDNLSDEADCDHDA